MKVYVFAIYDDKAKAFLPPFFMQQPAMAVRAFGSAVNDPNHQFFRHAADYSLFTLGMFDDSSGLLEPLSAPSVISNGLMLRESEVSAGNVKPNGSIGNQEDSIHA